MSSTDDIPAFLRNIRHGRGAPAEVIAEVQRRYAAIGGSPLMRITAEQGEALEARLGQPVRVAGRLWPPYPRAVLKELIEEGVDTVVSLPLAPQSAHIYNAAVERAAAELAADGFDVELRMAPSWGLEPALLDAFVEAIDEAGAADAIVLTAHSLPMRVIEGGDPYERDFRAMAEAVTARLEGTKCRIAYQSQGMGGGTWLGPALDDVMVELRKDGVNALLIAPIGFVAEHVETLYDIDMEAKARAEELGFERIARMPAMDTRPRFIDALEAVARRLL